MEEKYHEEIEMMLKALADYSRLSLLRRLHAGEQTVGDLAKSIDLGEPTVSHHLSRLREAGLVTLRMAGNQRFYRANESGLAKFKRLAQNIEIPPPQPERAADDGWIACLGWDAQDQQVLREHTRGGKITHLPNKQKKLMVLLRWLATHFAPDQRYSELEVNEVLKRVYAEDYVSLRRDLVDSGYLRRERGGGKYWLAPEESNS
jgi:hypothetical protein